MRLFGIILAFVLTAVLPAEADTAPESPSADATSAGPAGDGGASALDKAAALYSDAIARNPGDLNALTARAQVYLFQKHYEQAIADYTSLIKHDSRSLRAYAGRAQAWRGLRDYDKAASDYAEAVSLNPGNGALHFVLGLTYMDDKKFPLAFEQFDTLLKANPDNDIVLFARGFAYALKPQPDYAAALKDVNAAIQLKPQDPNRLLLRAGIHERQGDYGPANADIEDAIRLKPDSALAYNARCWERGLQNVTLDDAMADCNKALALAPDNPATLDSRGFIHFRKGELQDAIADYDSALRINPKHAGALYKRGIAKIRAGDAAGGQADIKSAIAMDANAADDMTEIGITP